MINRVKKTKYKFKGGYSLVELIVTVALMSAILTVTVKLLTGNLTQSNTENNRIDARSFAIEGLEIVELNGYEEFCSSNSCYKTLNGYNLDNNEIALDSFDEDTDMKDIMQGNESTPFKRIIRFDKTGLTNAYEVNSIVRWIDSTGDHSFEAKSFVYQPD